MNGLVFVVSLGILFLIFVALIVAKTFKNVATSKKAYKILEISIIVVLCLMIVITTFFITLTIIYKPNPAIGVINLWIYLL